MPELDSCHDPTGHFAWEPCAHTIVTSAGLETMRCVADVANIYGLRSSFARPFAWDDRKRQFRWHKTWRVPDLTVSADPAALGGRGGIEAHVAVVCASTSSAHQLEDAGVTSTATGPSGADAVLAIIDGEARFSRMRLRGTTATFGGRAFHFVVSLLRTDPDLGGAPTVLASLISTSFAVYSRKNADKQKPPVDSAKLESGRWSEGYSYVPFDPKELNRSFVKKTTGPDGATIEQPIDNSWEGLLNYFAAPNIRHKVRHPLFLAIRFSNVLVILRDALRFPDENEDALRSFICSCGFPLRCVRDPAVDLGHGEFLPPNLIALRSSAFETCPPDIMHKLVQALGILKGPALGFVPDDRLVPARYQPLIDVQSLIPLYTRLYATEFAGLSDRDDNHGGLSSADGALSDDSPAESDRKRVKTDSSAEHDSWSNHTSPESNCQVSPKLKDAHHRSPMQADTNDDGKQAFELYFKSLHTELRHLLKHLVELATKIVSDRSERQVSALRNAYRDFTEALTVHASVEETILFSKLNEKLPQMTDTYYWDHDKSKSSLEVIQQTLGLEREHIASDLSPEAACKLFMQVSELAAIHTMHMQKEEEHLLPLFVKTMSNSEMRQLITLSERKSISLSNMRHQNSINMARRAVGIEAVEYQMGDPPTNVNSPTWFF